LRTFYAAIKRSVRFFTFPSKSQHKQRGWKKTCRINEKNLKDLSFRRCPKHVRTSANTFIFVQAQKFTKSTVLPLPCEKSFRTGNRKQVFAVEKERQAIKRRCDCNEHMSQKPCLNADEDSFVYSLMASVKKKLRFDKRSFHIKFIKLISLYLLRIFYAAIKRSVRFFTFPSLSCYDFNGYIKDFCNL